MKLMTALFALAFLIGSTDVAFASAAGAAASLGYSAAPAGYYTPDDRPAPTVQPVPRPAPRKALKPAHKPARKQSRR